ncbi:MAG: dehydratase [Peptococcaceae bacterium]|nr:dehydratase [Peptococcaceae bacterium]
MPDFDRINTGDEMPVLKKEPVNQIQLVKYAGASGDFNPLHYVDAVGKAAGQGGVIAHGMLIMGFMGQAVTDWIPNRCLKSFKVRFMKVTRPGDAITVSGRITGKKIVDGRGLISGEVAAADQHGQVKAAGTFEAWV